jgi:uncharacterized membrane protein YfcA
VTRYALLATFVLVGVWHVWHWLILERARGVAGTPRAVDVAIGFVTNFFDALGIGSFAPTTALYKFLKRMPDEEIPGTLNVGHAFPTTFEAVIFVAIVQIDIVTLVAMIAASVAGALLGAGIVTRLPRRAIQLGMGAALLIAASLFIARNLEWLPAGGAALALSGGTLVFAVAVNFVLGVLMMLGVGLYAPCLILVSLLGMNPLAAFPIMMGSCALLQPAGGARFVRAGRYNPAAARGLTLGGIPGVLIAAFIVKSLPIEWLRWLVSVAVIYAALMTLRSAWHATRAQVVPT